MTLLDSLESGGVAVVIGAVVKGGSFILARMDRWRKSHDQGVIDSSGNTNRLVELLQNRVQGLERLQDEDNQRLREECRALRGKVEALTERVRDLEEENARLRAGR